MGRKFFPLILNSQSKCCSRGLSKFSFWENKSWHIVNHLPSTGSKFFLLTLKAPSKFCSKQHSKISILFFYFSEITSLDISCELSAKEIIHIKCQDLFSLKNKNKWKQSSAAVVIGALRGLSVASLGGMIHIAENQIIFCCSGLPLRRQNTFNYECSPFEVYHLHLVSKQ